MTATPLPYLIVDADQHSMPPPDAYERYICQLKNLSEAQTHALMRANMGRFLGLAV